MQLERLLPIVLLFFVYSFIGWCIEVTLKYFQFRRFINRGFLTGPILPIYGAGAVLITLAVGDISRFEYAVGTTFAISFILCGALEYGTSWVLEKRFHARWWDYSQKPMNLHGRIWIGNLVLFGLGGVAIVHAVNPVLYGLLAAIPRTAQELLSAGLLAVFSADAAMSHFIMKLVKAGIEGSEADDTEQINAEIRLLLSDRSVFHRRFADAYPEVIYRTERISARLAAIREETERLRLEAEQRLEEGAGRVADALEPAAFIKNTIIEKQDALIFLLYDEDSADEEMKKLKTEIDAERRRLDARPLLRRISPPGA